MSGQENTQAAPGHPDLPHLTYLHSALTAAAPSAGNEPAVAMQVAMASGLLDHMMVERSAAPEFKAASYLAMKSLLPVVRQALASDSGAAAALAEMEALCSAADAGEYRRFNALLQEIQRRLLPRDTAAVQDLCKRLFSIEAGYNRSMEAAVVARRAAAGKAAATARNTRDYDEKRLLEFIRREFPDEKDVGIAKSSFITGGYSKFTLRIDLSNTRNLPNELIMRADAAATYGGASVREEYRLFNILHAHGVRVPKPYAVEESGAVFGSPFMLVERKYGASIGHIYVPPKPNAAVCRDIAAQLAAIHRVPVDNFAGAGVSNLKGRNSDKALEWIEEGLAAWRPLQMPSATFETSFDWLRRNAAIVDKAPRTLVHGDVHLHNMLVHEDKVSGIFDWEFAHIGSAAYDLGYFYDQACALDSWEAFLAAYGAAGAPVPDREQLDYAVLLAATRVGVMVCQAEHEFTSGRKPGMAGAAVISKLYYEQTISRVARALQRVM